jgi:putative hemolysin
VIEKGFMAYNAIGWLLLNFFSIMILSFYSMMEMACVSFNKVRLQYYISKDMKRAIWLNYLLQNSTRLFGTTLIGVNVAMFAGSEFSREFHQAIGVNPDWSPISQVIIVLIFGELAPMFAARRYAENVAMIGVPFVYTSAIIMKPLLWGIGQISKLCNLLITGRETQSEIFLSQEELQKILEEQDEDLSHGNTDEFNTVTTNIFNLRQKTARQIMEPINTIAMVPSHITIENIRPLFKKADVDYLAIYHREKFNVVGIVLPRNLIRAPDSKRARDFAEAPWFVTQNTPAMQILKQFRRNNESLAVILDARGVAVGIIQLDDLLEEIFGTRFDPLSGKTGKKSKQSFILQRTFPGNMKVADFNKQFDVILSQEKDKTLSDLITESLEHNPQAGDSIYIEPFELKVKEASLLEIKSVIVTTRIK